jgi:ActR/RegA family two-component response regulator
MERRAKVELFEQIRREYEFGVGSIKGVARKLGVHRRMVRQALRMHSHRSASRANACGR